MCTIRLLLFYLATAPPRRYSAQPEADHREIALLLPLVVKPLRLVR